MPTSSGLPPELQELFSAPDPARTLSIALPPGRTVRGNEGQDEKPALWVSDGPATVELWRSLRAEQSSSGLAPLLLESEDHDADRPWNVGELWPGDMSSPEDYDAAAVLAEWWDEYTEPDQEGQPEMTAPFGRRWPGLAPSRRASVDPEEHADRCAAQMLAENSRLRMGLVAAQRSSDAPAVTGWHGPVNYIDDTAMVSAVLRSWESRFGGRLIGMGFADLYVSVAAPPTSRAEALPVAAEHYAFCPDGIGQMDTLIAYADGLVGEPLWSFWWD